MKVIALDFECANTYAYYSIFWTGIIVSNEQLEEVEIISKTCNPLVKNFFVGKITFPYTMEDLRKELPFRDNHKFLTDLLDEDTIVIGHAINNDIAMLLSAVNKFGLKEPTFRYIDTNTLYSRYKGINKDTSLKTIAKEFGIEYSEHDPSEDARATLAVAREIAKRENVTFQGLLDKYQVEVGFVKNGHSYKTYSRLMPDKQVKKMGFINESLTHFDNAEHGYNMRPIKYHFDTNIFAQFDITELLNAIAKAGDRIVESTHIANYDIKFSDRAIDDKGKMSLKQLYSRYSIDYDLSKIVRKNNIHEYIKGFFVTKRNVELLQMFREVIKCTKVIDNTLKCRRVAISKGVEKYVGYDKIFRLIAAKNGRFTPYVNQASVLIIYDENELHDNPYSCRKITTFLKQEQPKIRLITYNEFNK